MNKPSCYNCQHAKVFKGTIGNYENPPEPDEVECMVEDVTSSLELLESMYDIMDWDSMFQKHTIEEELLAERCGHYKPRMIEQCACCKDPMNVPEYSWELWAWLEENVPVCSPECKATMEKRYTDYMMELGKIYGGGIL
jgi:hypothetical protein